MTTTLRYPFVAPSPEQTQIITILPAVTQLRQGGEATFANIKPWKTQGDSTEAPYTAIVLEFTASAALIVGDGTTEAIGLFGQRGTGATGKSLLGVLGYFTAPSAKFGQLFILDVNTGFSQIVVAVDVFDGLSIGGITSAITFDAAQTLTCKARPIFTRTYVG